MGSPLGPLMANALMCNIGKQLDTLGAMPDFETAPEFLTTLNNSHPSIDFTMEL